MWISLGIVGVGLLLVMVMLATALQLATSHLEELDREPLPPAPRRPVWLPPNDGGKKAA